MPGTIEPLPLIEPENRPGFTEDVVQELEERARLLIKAILELSVEIDKVGANKTKANSQALAEHYNQLRQAVIPNLLKNVERYSVKDKSHNIKTLLTQARILWKKADKRYQELFGNRPN